MNRIFASEKLENSDDIFDAVANITINDVGYKLKISTASDTHVKFAGNPDKITHTINVDTHQKLLSIRTISICSKYISVLVPLTDNKIGVDNQPALLVSTVVVQAPQALQLSAF